MNRFNGKVVVVTGGNSGMGLASAKQLAAEGAKVVITGRDQKSLEEAVAAIGGEVLGVRTDILKLSDIENLFAQTSAKFGKIDVLFVNAGIGIFAPLEEVDEVMFDQVADTNFKGSYFTVKYALPYLNDGASIVLNTSANTKLAMATASLYGASKSALDSLRKNLAIELVGRGIRVNSVSPGPIDTPIIDRSGMPEEAKQGMRAHLTSLVPMKRFGTSEEVAKTVAFLASDDASFITGVEINVDGGMTLL